MSIIFLELAQNTTGTDGVCFKSNMTIESNGNMSSPFRRTMNYISYDVWDKQADPVMSHLPILSSGPWITFGFTLLYFIIIKYLLPHYMKNREPYQMRKPMLYYNLFNVVVNSIGFIIGMWETNFSADIWGCSTKKLSPLLVYCGYGYFLLKYVDFLETIFFLLRKKFNQVSFLHVSHHCLMPNLCYFGMKYIPNRHVAFIPLINSLVHAIMYTYYYLAALGPQYSKFLWWKEYITRIQLIQFSIGIFHSLHPFFVPGCHYKTKIFAVGEFFQALFFLSTFSSFYFQSYRKKSETKKVD